MVAAARMQQPATAPMQGTLSHIFLSKRACMWLLDLHAKPSQVALVKHNFSMALLHQPSLPPVTTIITALQVTTNHQHDSAAGSAVLPDSTMQGLETSFPPCVYRHRKAAQLKHQSLFDGRGHDTAVRLETSMPPYPNS